MPSSVPVAVVDALNSLLEAQLNSAFRALDASWPYLSRTAAEVRRPLAEMRQVNQRQIMELADAIRSVGGEPLPPSIQPEEQYLAYLSLSFLLPKLVEAKELNIRRYEATLNALGNRFPEVRDLLASHLAEHRAHLEALKKSAADVAAAAAASGQK